MSTCHGCGGVVGRDCYNPVECEMIAREMQHQHDEATALTPEEASTLASLRAGTHVVVPREPTMAMLRAGVHGEPGFYTHSNTAALMGAWRRMLAAAQEAGHE